MINSLKTVKYCVVNKDCDGPSNLTATSYGMTGGDKWVCKTCESFVVTRPQNIPEKPI